MKWPQPLIQPSIFRGFYSRLNVQQRAHIIPTGLILQVLLQIRIICP
jgi:hypothetical protein